MTSSPGCVTFPDSLLTITSPASLSRTTPTSFITREGKRLQLDNADFKAVGPNVYWLGLDENINSSISYPTRDRVLEIMATAAAMGATTVRSHTLGNSIGHPLSISPSLGVFNEEALQAVDFAIYAASTYGIRLIIPLVDQWDYYHGGKLTFLRFRNIATSDDSAFYTNTDVVSDFKQYIGTIINRTNTYTNDPYVSAVLASDRRILKTVSGGVAKAALQVSYASDPTIMCWETGNELKDAPALWTSDISSYIKTLAPNHLVMDGSYGPQKDALDLPTVDMYTNHYYPLERQKLKSDVKAVAAANKVYYIGEYDWTDKYSKYGLLGCLIPLIFVIIAFCLPGRWFPWTFYLPRWNSCMGKNRKGSSRPANSSYSTLHEDQSQVGLDGADAAKIEGEYPPPLPITGVASHTGRRKVIIRKWMFALSFLLLVPFAAWIALEVGPITLNRFHKLVEDRDVAGSAYWSLFGRDESCCQWVEHDDGFTLHYRRESSIDRSQQLAQHAYRMSGATPAFSVNNKVDLPVIGCPAFSSNGTRR